MINGVIVTRKVPPRRGSSNRLVVALGPRLREFARPGPCRQFLADQRVERPIEQARARRPCPLRERIVRLHDVQLVVGDDDQIQNRVEGVLEQAALAQNLLEQLRCSRSPPRFAG